jgi:hypothetical protein
MTPIACCGDQLARGQWAVVIENDADFYLLEGSVSNDYKRAREAALNYAWLNYIEDSEVLYVVHRNEQDLAEVYVPCHSDDDGRWSESEDYDKVLYCSEWKWFWAASGSMAQVSVQPSVRQRLSGLASARVLLS